MSKYQKEKNVAISAVRKAATICRATQFELDLKSIEKKDKSPVTIADFSAQAIICKVLSKQFPKDPVIGEEDPLIFKHNKNKKLLSIITDYIDRIFPGVSEYEVLALIDKGGHKTYADRFWTIDPVDGTKGFLRNDQYAISLSLIIEGEVVVGALCCPNLSVAPYEDEPIGVVFFAEKGEGAFQKPLEGSEASVPIYVSTQSKKSQIRICESVEKDHTSHANSTAIVSQIGIFEKPIRIDSQAKYATVARGCAEAYIRLPRKTQYKEKIWDHAGGSIIVKEAGGKVTDILGEELDFKMGRRLENNLGVVATNGMCHDVIIKAISELNIRGF